jgi:outer membrane protein
MKYITLLFLTLLFAPAICPAQKFGYIDTDVILKQMPEYKEAEGKMNELSAKYEKEISGMKSELDKLNIDYKNEEILLTDEMRQERLAMIAEKEKALKDYQKKIFGFDGLIFSERQALMKKPQEALYTAVEKVAKKYSLQFIFDRSSELVIIYSSPVHDYSDYVLEELGLGDKNDVIDK